MMVDEMEMESELPVQYNQIKHPIDLDQEIVCEFCGKKTTLRKCCLTKQFEFFGIDDPNREPLVIHLDCAEIMRDIEETVERESWREQKWFDQNGKYIGGN